MPRMTLAPGPAGASSLTLVADADTLVEDAPADGEVVDTPDADGPDGDEMLRVLIIVEDVWSGDQRMFTAGSVEWRDLPLPFMATDRTTWAHEDAVLIGQFVNIERVGAEIWGDVRLIDSDDDDVRRLQRLVREGDLPGVSADLDLIELEFLIPEDSWMMDDEPPVEDGYIVLRESPSRTRYTAARVMGATAVPFPALAEAHTESLRADGYAALVASGLDGWVECHCDDDRLSSGHPIVKPPMLPPVEWFDDPGLDEPTALTVADDGRVFGHLAVWGQCHVGFSGECVTPPRSLSNYAHYRLGEIICADGSRRPVGKLTYGGGHAPLNANAARAAQHYDDAGTAVVDFACGEDAVGIWLAGALRPGLDALTIRALMASEISGDWRRIGGGLELVAVLAVNVPGFPKPRGTLRRDEGQVASLVASFPVEGCERRSAPADPERRAFELMARAIGRDRQSRLAELSARIRPEGR